MILPLKQLSYFPSAATNTTRIKVIHSMIALWPARLGTGYESSQQFCLPNTLQYILFCQLFNHLRIGI